MDPYNIVEQTLDALDDNNNKIQLCFFERGGECFSDFNFSNICGDYKNYLHHYFDKNYSFHDKLDFLFDVFLRALKGKKDLTEMEKSYAQCMLEYCRHDYNELSEEEKEPIDPCKIVKVIKTHSNDVYGRYQVENCSLRKRWGLKEGDGFKEFEEKYKSFKMDEESKKCIRGFFEGKLYGYVYKETVAEYAFTGKVEKEISFWGGFLVE